MILASEMLSQTARVTDDDRLTTSYNNSQTSVRNCNVRIKTEGRIFIYLYISLFKNQQQKDPKATNTVGYRKKYMYTALRKTKKRKNDIKT